MYEEYYGLTADPFRLTPDPDLCFMHSEFTKAQAAMEYALRRKEGFIVISGQPGTGKSTLICDLIAHLPETITFTQITSSQLSSQDLLSLISLNFGISSVSGNSTELLNALHLFFLAQQHAGKHTLLIIDEAQNLSEKALEELPLLTNLQSNNKPFLQIFLVGQEKLQTLIAAPNLTQLRQKIIASYHMKTLNENDTQRYIQYRLSQCNWQNTPVINSKVFHYIHRFSNGIPRVINLICSRLFMHGWLTKKNTLNIQDIHTIIHELREEQLLPMNRLHSQDKHSNTLKTS
ncbi:ExeA family protein [Neptunomonas antarctica]|uniref:Type II secretory pathway, component ExeA (Predicted ATPase) n=1 Tax=Neptunomonas antarctica TaxID=619304 RepID=A0A1N7JFF7_9GAMM|nr:AAA family ATPase [Neptunomonas antarctica]SIS47986.1 Type II secretory pathway, component ExeA (predicted ATPase) [Neptunomonas antarctica]